MSNEPDNEISADRIRDAITLAKNMRNNGASLEQIESRLALRGFDRSKIEAVMSHVPTAEPDNLIVRKDSTHGGRVVLVLAGMIVFGLGLLAFFGNRTGLAPTVPFFGFALMIVGGAIMNAGRS